MVRVAPALLLLLASCDREPEPVTIRPTLACSEAVHCKVYQWSVGFPRHIGGAQLAGTHIRCHCYSNAAGDRWSTSTSTTEASSSIGL